jgi:hypothetical protein
MCTKVGIEIRDRWSVNHNPINTDTMCGGQGFEARESDVLIAPILI